MQFPLAKVSSMPRKFSFVALCLLVVSVLAVAGCSKPKEKEAKEEKQVVHDLNIQTPDDTPAAGGNDASASGAGTASEAAKANADEVESLPFESGGGEAAAESVEEELPVLGGGN